MLHATRITAYKKLQQTKFAVLFQTIRFVHEQFETFMNSLKLLIQFNTVIDYGGNCCDNNLIEKF